MNPAPYRCGRGNFSPGRRLVQVAEPSPSLEELRGEIALRDRALIMLLAERVHLARRAIRLRGAVGAPVTDVDQEQRVLRRARGWADDCGVPPDLVERFFRELIEHGKSADGAVPGQSAE